MPKKLPLSLFSEQFFPDVTLQRVLLTSTELIVTVSDGTWELGPKLLLFEGAGAMIFTYTGAPRLRWRKRNRDQWQYASDSTALEHVADLLMIQNNPTGWEFRFIPERKEYIVEVVLPAVTAIAWDGPGEDIEDPED